MKIPDSKMENIVRMDLIKFYKYLFLKKKTDVLSFFLLTFLLPLLPYIWVALKLINQCESQRRSFYGDGSMITLCAGILCSYFVILFEYKNDLQKKKNSIINICLVVAYVVMVLVFVECQLNFDRSWTFIFFIIILSAFLLVITFLSAAYLTFERNCDNQEVDEFFETRDRIKMKSVSDSLERTEDGVKL